MRALVLILACVVMLATIQAAYSSIEAARQKAEADHRKSHHRNHDRFHHGKHHAEVDGAKTESLHKTEDRHDRSSQEDSNSIKSHKDTKHHRSKSDRAQTQGMNARSIMASTPRNYANHKIDSRHGNTIEGVDGSQPSKLRIRVERIDHPFERTKQEARLYGSSLSMGRKQDSKYEEANTENIAQKLQEVKAHHSKTGSKWGQSHESKTNLYNEMGGKGSSYHHGPHAIGKISCKTDADCDGGCCIQLKNGKSKCKVPNFRDVGEKCTSTCVCKSGLQCYVSSFRKNGQKKLIKTGRRIVGHCMARSMADLTRGHFLPSFKDEGGLKF